MCNVAFMLVVVVKGEKLTVEDSSGDWWRVRNALGQTGLIPASYIRMPNESFLSKLLRRSSRGNGGGNKNNKSSQEHKKHTAINISPPQDVHQNSGYHPRDSYTHNHMVETSLKSYELVICVSFMVDIF